MPNQVEETDAWDTVCDAMEHIVTIVRNMYCDNNFEWTEDSFDMPNNIAQAYESCDIVETFLQEQLGE